MSFEGNAELGGCKPLAHQNYGNEVNAQFTLDNGRLLALKTAESALSIANSGIIQFPRLTEGKNPQGQEKDKLGTVDR